MQHLQSRSCHAWMVLIRDPSRILLFGNSQNCRNWQTTSKLQKWVKCAFWQISQVKIQKVTVLFCLVGWRGVVFHRWKWSVKAQRVTGITCVRTTRCHKMREICHLFPNNKCMKLREFLLRIFFPVHNRVLSWI